MTLFWQQFKAQLTGLLIWTGCGIGLTWMMGQTAPSFIANDLLGRYLATLPDSMIKVVGLERGMLPLDAFVASQLAKTLVLIIPFYCVLLALNVVTREVDRRSIDFLLALPVRRIEVLLGRSLVMLVNSLLVTAAMALTMYLTFTAAGLQGNWATYNLLFLNVWLLSIALGSMALLGSLWIDDYGVAVKLMLGLVSVAYFMELVFRAVDLGRTVRYLSPFSYVDAVTIIRNGALPAGDTAVVVSVTLLCIGLSVPVFEKKQIAA